MPTKYGGKGIGKALVKAAEDKLLEIARCQWDGVFHPKHIDSSSMSLEVVMEMGVINQRTDLFPWYSYSNFEVVMSFLPFVTLYLVSCFAAVTYIIQNVIDN